MLRETSPPIWRRFLVRSDSSLVDLPQTSQIAFGWSGRRAFVFEVQGYRQGVRLEGHAREMRLADFRLSVKERFAYTYTTTKQARRPGRFELRLEQKLARDVRQHYPRCIGGRGAPPPERCGGAVAFESLCELFTPEYVVGWTKERRAEGWRAEPDEELRQLQPWIQRQLDRRASNQQLGQIGHDPRKASLQP